MNLGLGLSLSQTPVCDRTLVRDRCEPPTHDDVACPDCGARYHRCDKHGGIKGARRSLTSHKGLCMARGVPVAKLIG